MYLTKINHDFNFILEDKIDEVLYTLEFKKIFMVMTPPFFTSKITFQTNQGRDTYLLWYVPPFKKKKRYVFVVENIVKFYWEEGSQSIRYQYLKDADDTLVKYWLLHTFLPLFYILEGMYDILHVGAIQVGEKALLFAAPSFGGKSTLTHYFLEQGHALLSDDRLGIIKRNDGYYAVPSYPYARNYRELENLGNFAKNFAKSTLPIEAFFYLKKVGPEDEVRIKKVKGYEKFSVLEMSHDIKLSSLKLKNFFTLHDLTQSSTIYELQVPQDIHRLEEVYDIIIKTIKRTG